MTDRSHLIPLVQALGAARVAVAGDVMLDVYVGGTVERISPEAPIPVLRIERETEMPGGAGNVARNIAALGGRAVLFAAAGPDDAAGTLKRLFAADGRVAAHLFSEPGRRTALKTRYVAGQQQILRADRETVAHPGAALRAQLVAGVKAALAECQVLILSDYGKGVLADGVAAELIKAAREAKRSVIVDPKGRDWSIYAGADVITPNRRELAEAVGREIADDESVIAAARETIARHRFGAVLATRSQDGMTLVRADGSHAHFRAEAREVFDVSGAGDTVAAALAALLA
ncbi:MAG: bifunctional heptose 7-phosphate kinase/heptose 1-phosphate adenyltransferase, partial [Alphaproteobacteria bacterium]|nr:bifunctional heptose 7-phosphate kinase/heptose 1-phosphate adenyltransferase [Alphaproteobacteria bacterium]